MARQPLANLGAFIDVRGHFIFLTSRSIIDLNNYFSQTSDNLRHEANGREILLFSDNTDSPMALFAMMELQSVAPDKFYCRRGHPKTSQLLANREPIKSFSVLSLSSSPFKVIFEAEETKIGTKA